MGCPASANIGEDLVFSICTHDPDTGVLTDADAAPSYRIYEDETSTPILTWTMAKLDDGNTTGFYTELVAISVANGFERGKNYTIYISATVDGDTGGISFGFKVDPAGWTIPIVEAYPAYDATSVTPAQALYSIMQALEDFAISGAYISVKKLDGTEAMRFLIDSETVPTSRSRTAPA